MITKGMLNMTSDKRLAELQKLLADLKKRWPAHSVKPQMIEELERIEEEIAKYGGDSVEKS